MKINGNYFNTPIGKKNIQQPSHTEKTNFKSQLQSMDSITISASKSQIADAQFVNSLKSKLTSEINTEKSPEELNALSEQISRGEYEIGANEVAKRMLLANGNESL